MLRYHKEVYTKPGDNQRLEAFTGRLNGLSWRYTRHSLENIKYRAIDTESLLRYIKDLRLEAGQIFEYYTDFTGNLIKACYRIAYNKMDIILVVSYDKSIVTLYMNSCGDNHITLKKELYTRG